VGSSAYQWRRCKKLKLAVALVEKELDYDCGTCSPELQLLRGCREDSASRAFWIRLEGEEEEIKRCPLATVPMKAYRTLQLTNLLEIGLLPDPGGVLDQANSFISAANVVAAARRKATEDGS
jgi:hypothetical protein